MADSFSVLWYDSGLEPRVRFNPAHPDGIDVDGSGGASKTCKVDLPYPAARCGTYQIRCRECGLSVGVTTAGRIDDPRSVKLPCHIHRMR